MKDIHIAVGINPAGTTLVMKPIDASRPHAFGPERFLSDLERLGYEATAGWIGDIALRVLSFNHYGVFAPFKHLSPPPHPPTPPSDVVVALDPFTYDGIMQAARVEIGILDTADSLLIQPVNGRIRWAGSELSLFRLNALGFAGSASWIGQNALIGLEQHYPEEFALYPRLAVPPKDLGV
jgi:hypothetical protein